MQEHSRTARYASPKALPGEGNAVLSYSQPMKDREPWPTLNDAAASSQKAHLI